MGKNPRYVDTLRPGVDRVWWIHAPGVHAYREAVVVRVRGDLLDLRWSDGTFRSGVPARSVTERRFLRSNLDPMLFEDGYRAGELAYRDGLPGDQPERQIRGEGPESEWDRGFGMAYRAERDRDDHLGHHIERAFNAYVRWAAMRWPEEHGIGADVRPPGWSDLAVERFTVVYAPEVAASAP